MKRKADPATDTWQAIYTSLMLIVVAFFIFLISVSHLEKDKFESFVAEKQKLEAPAQAKPELTTGLDRSDTAFYEGVRTQILSYVEEKGLEGLIEVLPYEKGLAVRITADLLFASGEAQVRTEGKPLLSELAQMAREKGLHVQIFGHTDSDPIRLATYPSNWELSLARALAVLKHFQQEASLPLTGMKAVGFGEHRPVADNNTPEGKRKNRRVEMYLSRKPH
jgi:chemotaxis protein MotB